jgi:hypothetical protein
MNRNLKYPQWQNILASAILEFDATRGIEKLEQAKEAITSRIRELAVPNSNEHEHRLLSDGLWIIEDMRKATLI